MGFVKKLMLVIVFFISLEYFSGMYSTPFSEMIFPNSEIVIGNGACFIGAFILQPVVNINGLAVPIPVYDDIIFMLAFSLAITAYVAKSWTTKRKWMGFIILMGIGFALYKAIGYILLMFAENTYGITNCLEEIVLGGTVIHWSTFTPMHYIGIIIGGLLFISGLFLANKKLRGGKDG